MEMTFVKDSQPVQQERRHDSRETLSADDRKTWFRKYVTASGSIIPELLLYSGLVNGNNLLSPDMRAAAGN